MYNSVQIHNFIRERRDFKDITVCSLFKGRMKIYRDISAIKTVIYNRTYERIMKHLYSFRRVRQNKASRRRDRIRDKDSET